MIAACDSKAGTDRDLERQIAHQLAETNRPGLKRLAVMVHGQPPDAGVGRKHAQASGVPLCPCSPVVDATFASLLERDSPVTRTGRRRQPGGRGRSHKRLARQVQGRIARQRDRRGRLDFRGAPIRSQRLASQDRSSRRAPRATRRGPCHPRCSPTRSRPTARRR